MEAAAGAQPLSYGMVVPILAGLQKWLAEAPEELSSVQRAELARLLKDCLSGLEEDEGERSRDSWPKHCEEASKVGEKVRTDASEEASPVSRGQDIKVLIVDDELVTARLLEKQLEQLKIRCEWRLSGKEALDVLYERPNEFDLVLCDVNMPGLSGDDVLVRVLEMEQLRNMPVVMVSTDDDLEKAKRLVNAGAKDYIVKPVTKIALLSLSLKVKSWRQESSSQALSAVYGITSGLLVQLTLVLGTNEGVEVPTLRGIDKEKCNPESVVVQNTLCSMSSDSVHVRKAIIREASLPMLQLLGVSKDAIESLQLDIFDFVYEEDKPILRNILRKRLLLPSHDKPHEERVVWRWIDSNRHSLPVVGSMIRIGKPAERQFLMESSSLLPSLMLKMEAEKRAKAEENLTKAELVARRAEEESRLLRDNLGITKRSDESMRLELMSLLGEASEFSKMLTENPNVLTWRIHVDSGIVDFVTSTSCETILHYKSSEVVGKQNSDFVFDEDRETAAAGIRNMHEPTRIRRLTKEGDIVWLESRPYAWWDEKCTIIIVTEQDISCFIGSSSN